MEVRQAAEGTPDFRRWHNGERGVALDAFRIVQCQAIPYPSNSVVSDHSKGLQPEFIHQLHQCLRYSPLGPALPLFPLAASVLEPVQSLLRVGQTALKMASECSFTIRKLRFLSHFCLVCL